MERQEILDKISAATTAAEIINNDLIKAVNDLENRDTATIYYDKAKTIVATTTDLEGLRLFKVSLVDHNLRATKRYQDNELRKSILLQIITTGVNIDIGEAVDNLCDDEVTIAFLKNKIATATTVMEMINIISPLNDFDDEEITMVFCEKIKNITVTTIDFDGLRLLKRNLVDDSLYTTSGEQDNELRKIILLQIITFAPKIFDIKDAVYDLDDPDVTAAYEASLK